MLQGRNQHIRTHIIRALTLSPTARTKKRQEKLEKQRFAPFLSAFLAQVFHLFWSRWVDDRFPCPLCWPLAELIHFFLHYPFFLCFTIAVNNNNKRRRKYHGCYRSSTTCAPHLSITKTTLFPLPSTFFPAQHASWHTICFFFSYYCCCCSSKRLNRQGAEIKGVEAVGRERNMRVNCIYMSKRRTYTSEKKKIIRNNSEVLHFEWHRSFTKDNCDAGDDKKKRWKAQVCVISMIYF